MHSFAVESLDPTAENPALLVKLLFERWVLLEPVVERFEVEVVWQQELSLVGEYLRTHGLSLEVLRAF